MRISLPASTLLRRPPLLLELPSRMQRRATRSQQAAQAHAASPSITREPRDVTATPPSARRRREVHGGLVTQAELSRLVQGQPCLQLAVQRDALVAARARKPRRLRLGQRLVAGELDAEARRDVYQLVQQRQAAPDAVTCAATARSEPSTAAGAVQSGPLACCVLY